MQAQLPMVFTLEQIPPQAISPAHIQLASRLLQVQLFRLTFLQVPIQLIFPVMPPQLLMVFILQELSAQLLR